MEVRSPRALPPAGENAPGSTANVSVVIPARNSALWIGEAIESVRRQDQRPVEVIVADDGSDDTTATIARECGAKVLELPHRGPAAARNAGVAASSGDYIAFLDSDDTWVNDSLLSRLELFSREQEIGMVFGDLELRDAESMGYIGRYFDDRRELVEMEQRPLRDDAFLITADPVPCMLRRSFVSTIAAVMPRRVWDEVGGFDESLVVAEDADLWMRIAARFPIAYTTSVVAVYRRRRTSLTADNERVTLGLADAWRKFRDAYSGRYPGLRRLLNQNLGSYSCEAGRVKLAMNDPAVARRYFATGIRCIPTYKSAWIGYLSTFIRPLEVRSSG